MSIVSAYVSVLADAGQSGFFMVLMIPYVRVECYSSTNLLFYIKVLK